MKSRISAHLLLATSTLVAGITWVSAEADAKGKKLPVVGVVTEGIAERLHGLPKHKKGKKPKSEVGKVFTALCDGILTQWKVSDLGDDGAWVGSFTGGVKPKHCLLIDGTADPAMSAKGRPTATTAQLASAKSAAVAALTGKGGDAPAKVDVVVFHDGEEFVAVGQTTKANTGKGNCLDHTSLVVLTEHEGTWKPLFKPGGKGKDVCGYSFFTRADVDADGRDEIALRVDKGDGYTYRVLKRQKGTYTVVVK